MASRRVVRRYVLWLAIPLIKLVSLPACGPRDGQEGGSCHKAQGCHSDDYCDGGLTCRFGTCEKSPPENPPPAPSCSNIDSTSRCAPYEVAKLCPPRAEVGSRCEERDKDGDGNRIVCCEACFPSTALAEPKSCGAGDAGYACASPHTPRERIPSLKCVRNQIDGPWTSYCCATEDACFRVTDESRVCADAGALHVCTGEAIPSDPMLQCQRADTTSSDRHCCTEVDAGAGARLENESSNRLD